MCKIFSNKKEESKCVKYLAIKKKINENIKGKANRHASHTYNLMAL